MSYRMHMTIDDLPLTPNRLLGRHWRTRAGHAAKWKTLVRAFLGTKGPSKPLTRAKLTLTRFSSVEPDYDGLVGSFKPVIDALVHWKVLSDDTPSVIGGSAFYWEKTTANNGHVMIIIEEVKE